MAGLARGRRRWPSGRPGRGFGGRNVLRCSAQADMPGSRSGGRVFAARLGNHGRNNPANGQHAVEPPPARIAAVSRKSDEAFQQQQGARVDPVMPDALEVEISAGGAMGKTHESNRHAPGVESKVTRAASPGPQSHRRSDDIDQAPAMRTKTVRAPALRADHQNTSPRPARTPAYPKPPVRTRRSVPRRLCRGVE